VRQFDAADEAAVKAVVEDALQKYGRLDVMFANAGIASMKVFYETTTEEFMKMMKTNVLRWVNFQYNTQSRAPSTNLSAVFSSQQSMLQKPCRRPRHQNHIPQGLSSQQHPSPD